MEESPPFIIIVNGLPASGKTTIAKYLGSRLNLPVIHKDEINQVIAEGLTCNSLEESYLQGYISIKLLYKFAEILGRQGKSCIVESVFDPVYANEEWGIQQTKYLFNVIQIVCFAEGNQLYNRYVERSYMPCRPGYHFDEAKLSQGMAERLLQGKIEPINIPGPILEVDTTDWSSVNLGELVLTVMQHLKNKG